MAETGTHACSLADSVCCLCCLSKPTKPSKPKFTLHHHQWFTILYAVTLLLLSIQHQFHKETTYVLNSVRRSKHLLYSKLLINGYTKVPARSLDMTSNRRLGLIQLTIRLLLAADVELNPGPQPAASTQNDVMGLPFHDAQPATHHNNLFTTGAMARPLPYPLLALPGLSMPAAQSLAWATAMINSPLALP